MDDRGTTLRKPSRSPTDSGPADIVAIVLAAGRSSRMGSPKPLMRLRDRPLLGLTLEALAQARTSRVVVVLGHEADRVKEAVPFGGASVVVNAEYAQGLSTSVRAGIRAAGPASAYLFVLGDEPFVLPATYEALLRAWRPNGPRLVIPTYRGRRGNPVLVDGSLASEMEALTGDVGVRALFSRHATDTLALKVDDPAILVDLDRPDQVRTIEAGLDQGRPLKELLVQLATDTADLPR